MDALFYVWEFSHQIEDFVPIAAFVDLASAERLRSARWAAHLEIGFQGPLRRVANAARARLANPPSVDASCRRLPGRLRKGKQTISRPSAVA